MKNSSKYQIKTYQRLCTFTDVIDRVTGRVVAEGTAVLNPGDKNDPMLGRALAESRAFKHFLENRPTHTPKKEAKISFDVETKPFKPLLAGEAYNHRGDFNPPVLMVDRPYNSEVAVEPLSPIYVELLKAHEREGNRVWMTVKGKHYPFMTFDSTVELARGIKSDEWKASYYLTDPSYSKDFKATSPNDYKIETV